MKPPSIHVYLSGPLKRQLDRYTKDHPEVSISRLCSGFLGQYLYDRGYRPDGKEQAR